MSNQIVMYRYFYRGFNLRLLTLLVLVASTACSSASDTVIVKDGVYSLTETSLSQSKLPLRGQWAFFPDRFIEIPEVSSRGFQDSFDKAKRIAVPGEFPEDARSGQRHQAGTLVARVDTRLSTDTVVGVELFENATAHRIQLISDRGEILTSLLASEPGETADDERPAWKSVSTQFILPARVDAFYIIWHVSSWHYTWTGPWKSPVLREGAKSWQVSTLTWVREFTLMGILLALLFQHITLYRRQKVQRRDFWFIVLLSVFLIRQIVFSRFIELLGLGVSGEAFHLRRCIEYAMHPLSAAVVARVAYEMLDAPRFKAIQQWISRTMLPMAVAPFLFSASNLGLLVDVYQVVPSTAMLVITLGVWREARAGNRTARALWWVYVVFISAIAHDVLYAQGIIDSVYLANYCIIALIVLKSNQLGQEHSDALVTAEALSRELQTRVDERTAELELSMLREVESTKSALRKNLEMAELGRHVATIGHELHNPIGTTIALQSQLERDLDSVSYKLKEKLFEESAEVDNKLRDIRTGVEVLGVVSQRLDELSKILRRGSSIQSQRTPDVSLNEIVQETIILLDARLQSVELSLVLGDIPKLEAQRSHLSVVISNLLSNAVDALDEQSEPSRLIRVESGERCEGGRNWVYVRVEDNGPGVSPELREKVFEEFFTTKSRDAGTGIGLTLCREIVREHRGDLSIRSSESLKGACFEMILPST